VKSTRRGFLRSAGLTGLGASALGTGTLLAGQQAAAAATTSGVVPFYGAHQAGIVTPTQNYLEIAALDMVSDSVADLRRLLRAWTEAAARMSTGAPMGALRTGDSPPQDTGEAVGLGPAELTMTFGFGPTLFTPDRFGLAAHRPAPLVDLPAFLGDALQPAISGGDLVIQVCADDPQVAFHAVHDLIKLGLGVAQPRWLLSGFGRTANSRSQVLPRNLMGFQDGTANIMAQDTGALEEFVWAGEPSSPAWMRGGSYLVARRIQISLGLWDGTTLDGQQEAIGREKISGTRLSPMPPKAHIQMTSPGQNAGQQILRRGYSYVDDINPTTGDPNVGLMFLCYQADPRRQFIPIQQRIAGRDALSVYLTHIGSAIFACPPGARRGGYLGQELVG
jgi:deferrochelatase/peroxidase EfeB